MFNKSICVDQNENSRIKNSINAHKKGKDGVKNHRSLLKDHVLRESTQGLMNKTNLNYSTLMIFIYIMCLDAEHFT